MRFSIFSLGRRAVAVALLYTMMLSAAAADISDYEFQFVQNEVRKGDGTVISVRLVDKRTGAAVPDAVIFATRIDMAPDGMPTMTAPVEAVPSDEPGVYRFKADLIMAGGWRFSLAAKVQGEVGTVSNNLVLRALP